MKVLLVNPPRRMFVGSETIQGGLPLGLLYLAAALEQAGYEVEILDTLLDSRRPRREEDSLVYGMPWHDIESEIRERKPDLIGITNPFTAQLENALAIADIAKRVNPSLPTVIGGSHPTVQYIPLLRDNPNIDVVAIGEGELTLVDLVRAYSTGGDLGEVKGIAYRDDGEITVNSPREFIADLDTLPLPAYHLVDMERYLHPEGLRYRTPKFNAEIPMITSRGCTFNCVFCSIHAHMGKKWRAHSTEYVINHIDYVLKKYGVQHIHFEDDNLTLDIRRFEYILDKIIEKGLKFSWDTPNGIRADRLTPTLLRKMKESGCKDIQIGIESGNQEVLKHIIGKGLNLDNVVETASMCKEAGIPVTGFYVIGFPGEKLENMQQTVDFALDLKKKYNVGMTLFVATPLHGSQLYKICEDKGYLTAELTPRSLAEATQTWGKGLIRTEDFSPEDVKRIASQAVSSYSRSNFRNHLRHPIDTIRKAAVYRRDAVRYLKNLIKPPSWNTKQKKGIL